MCRHTYLKSDCLSLHKKVMTVKVVMAVKMVIFQHDVEKSILTKTYARKAFV